MRCFTSTAVFEHTILAQNSLTLPFLGGNLEIVIYTESANTNGAADK